jgi:seipin
LDYTEESATREVYKFPKRDIDAVEPGVSPSQLLVWPADFIIQAIGFQIKLIVQSVYFAMWLCSLTYAVMVFPLQKSIEATNLATKTVIDVYALTTQIRPMVTEGVAHAGPTIKHITKRCGCGCLAAIYVSFILGFLLIPAVFLDVFLVRSFIEDPTEIHQTLHFDYTREHPTAVVPLLPPKVLAKAKELAVKKPEKAYSFRAIPKSHKFHVTVFLTLPESDHNRKLGIFQVFLSTTAGSYFFMLLSIVFLAIEV